MVLVVQNGKVERRTVTTGAASGDEALICAGVTAGERVVAENPESLADGALVAEAKR